MKIKYNGFHFFFLFFFTFVFSGLVNVNAQTATYVGSETCLSCHNTTVGPSIGASDKTSWRTTLHANGYSEVLDDRNSMVLEKGIVNDADQNGIDDFHDGLDLATTPNFAKFGANAPKLAYSDSTGYTITIGNEVMRVYMTYGGSGMWKQRYAVKIVTTSGESADYYISPVQYNEKTHEYVQYDPDYWYDSNDQPIYDPATSTLADAANGKSFGKGCVGCHVTGLSVEQTADGEWVSHSAIAVDTAKAGNNPSYFDLDGDGDLDEINTGCETCHGPGSNHNGNPAGIINPERDMTPDQINNLCGMCHSRGHSQPNGTFGYSFDDQNLMRWTPQDIIDGKKVADYHTEGAGLWGDGVNSVKHHQQFEDLYKSSKPTFQFHQISCIDCHDAHGSAREHQIVEEREEEGVDSTLVTITTDVDDNSLCLSCHATHGDFADISVEMVANITNADSLAAIEAVVTQHTHHPYDPEGNGASRCTNCHMPKVAKSAIKYDIHSHTFDPIAPEKTKNFNMPNSCAVSCHGKDDPTYPKFGIPITAADFTDWAGANQQALADTLMHYYGPDGIWWKTTPVSVRLTDLETPTSYKLTQNYPNPFNPTTLIGFSVPQASDVSIVIYNSIGEKVEELVNTRKEAGNYFVNWDASQFASGIYFYRMQAGNFVQVKKMMLMK